MILDAAYPPDIRVEKEAQALIGAGYSVTLLSRMSADLPSDEFVGGVRVVRKPGLETGWFRRKVNALIYAWTFVSPVWRDAIREHVRNEPVDVLHVHDLAQAGSALSAVRGTDIPVVADFHENYPAAVGEWQTLTPGLRGLFNRWLYNYRRWHRQEGRVCSRVDRVIAVVDAMKERLIAQHCVPSDKVVVVTNTEQQSFVADKNVASDIAAAYADKFMLLYIGSYGPHRGLETVLDAATLLRGTIPNLKIAIVGKGPPAYDREILGRIAENQLEDVVELVGWQPFSRVFSYMSVAAVGLVPHHRNEQTDNTVPHKLFQFMMVGTPVLASSCRPLARIVEETGGGLIFSASDATDFADKVLTLYRDPERRAVIGERGRRATLQGPWCWEETGRILVALYDDLLK